MPSLTFTTVAFAALTTLASAKKTTATTSPCTTASPSSTTCETTLCADYINSCGQMYGGCYEACWGFTTPSFIDPGCPTITSSSSTLSTSSSARESCSLTICADYVNDCGQWYGGCYPACSGYPTPSFSEPPCTSSSTSTTKTKTKTPCTKTKCVDYVNECDRMYGGCFPACRGHTTPVFTDPGCTTASASPTGGSSGCNFVCSDFFDDCGNTFGPGCYTSCPGVPAPSYTTPVCNSDAGTYITTA